MIQCGFFDSVNKDRLYKAEEMSRPYELLISNGVFATPMGTPSTYLQVYADSGMKVAVRPGRGIFKDKWFINDSDLLFTLDTGEVNLTRIDTIVVRVDTSESVRAGTIVVKKGTPSSNPEPPAVERTSDVHEYRLANITVAPLVNQIEQSNVSDQRGSAECPWVTSLVNQVDTSTLFAQWEDAYVKYYDKATSEYEQFYGDNKARFDAYYNSVKSSFDTFYANNETRFDNYYSLIDLRFSSYYTEQVSRFDTQYANVQSKADNQYNANQTKFDNQYNANQTKFDGQYSTNQATFNKQCDDNQAEFDALFDDLKSTSGSLTMSVNTGYYKTTKDGEKTVNVTLDFTYLSVYINGLHAVPSLDYTLSGKTITLTKGVLTGTVISYVAFKQGSA